VGGRNSGSEQYGTGKIQKKATGEENADGWMGG